MSDFAINPRMLVWARERAQVSQEQLASKHLSIAKLREIESGKVVPSLTQAEYLANRLRVPILVFLLDKAPSSDLPIPDLRTIGPNQMRRVSPNFREVIDDCLVRQDWFREQMGRKTARIGRQSFTASDPVEEVAAYLASSIRLNDELRAKAKGWSEFLEILIEQAEAAGVLITRSNIVRHDGRRKLSVDEFRGFALGDPIAPLVFINSGDSIAAQTFTLVHELAHLCIQQSGISNFDTRVASSSIRNKVEIFCNKVAAETLVPKQKFDRAWSRQHTISENIDRITKFFRVSRLVALRCAHDRGKIEDELFFAEVEKEYDRFRRQKKEGEKNKKESGGNFWNSFRVRVGGKLTDAVVISIRQSKLSYTDAARILGVRPTTVSSLVTANAGAK